MGWTIPPLPLYAIMACTETTLFHLRLLYHLWMQTSFCSPRPEAFILEKYQSGPSKRRLSHLWILHTVKGIISSFNIKFPNTHYCVPMCIFASMYNLNFVGVHPSPPSKDISDPRFRYPPLANFDQLVFVDAPALCVHHSLLTSAVVWWFTLFPHLHFP
jgi:hypothetical protein